MNSTVLSATEKITPEQLKGLTALFEHGDKSKAARAAGVSRTTLYRWLREDPVFQEAYSEATRAALKEFSATLVRLAGKAAKALEDALDDSQDMHHRLRAADIVTARLLAVQELIDMEQRIAALEATYVQQG